MSHTSAAVKWDSVVYHNCAVTSSVQSLCTNTIMNDKIHVTVNKLSILHSYTLFISSQIINYSSHVAKGSLPSMTGSFLVI